MHRATVLIITLLAGWASLNRIPNARSDAEEVKVTVSATWQRACGRTFIKQHTNIANQSSAEICVTRRMCGTDKLLQVSDDQHNQIVFGLTCGRPNTGWTIQDYMREFVPINPGTEMHLYHGGPAAGIANLDGPEIPMSKSRDYFGTSEVEYIPCAEIRKACPGPGCTWQWFEQHLRIKKLFQVPVRFLSESCPKGFDPWAIDADPPAKD